MTAPHLSNSEYWRRYGDYVLMAMPYADQVLVSAQGCTVRDADGKELLDLASGMFCSVLGHNHPKFVERLSRQTSEIMHTGTQFLSPAVFEAARELAAIAPGELQKAIFLSTGTEANEFAFRLAKAYTGRTGIVGMSHGYYGTSLATKSCSSLFSHRRRDSLPTVPDTARIPITPQCIDCFKQPGDICDCSCLSSVESWMGDWSNIAAVIVEPILSAGGMLFPPVGYLQRLAEIAHGHGALLIVDEAQTGFGRTGKWFAIEHHGVQPDILTLSKSIGNGFPVSAVIATSEIADGVTREGFWNLSSHQSDPLAASAVTAVIEIAREENLPDRARESGEYFLSRLRETAAKQPGIANVRGLGLMIGFDIAAPEALANEVTSSFMYRCRHRGVHLTYAFGNVSIRIIPPLIISRREIDFAVEVIEASLRDALAKPDCLAEHWPRNEYTRRLLEQNPLRNLFRHWWQSSPDQWVRKASKSFHSKVQSGHK